MSLTNKKFTLLISGLAITGASLAGGTQSNKLSTHFRVSGAIGTRYIDTEVISNDAWDNFFHLGFSVFNMTCDHRCLYGLDVAANSSWISRFNSVNNSGSTLVTPLSLSNSTSLDFLVFWEWKPQTTGIEIGVGPEISWIKWLTATQQARSGVRIAPKIRLAVTHALNNRSEVFVAVSQAFNVYGSLRCSDSAFNCFSDSGYVYTSDLSVGVNYYFGTMDIPAGQKAEATL